MDIILIANEVDAEARKFNMELLLFKVDFEKAYDCVDMYYLEVVVNMNFSMLWSMVEMNFHVLWREQAIECVSTTTT